MRLDAISIITADMSAAVRFYSALGLELSSGGPDDAHTEFTSDSLRVLLDSEAVALSLDPDWTRPSRGHAMSLAFDCGTPALVDAAFAELTGSAGSAAPVAGVEKEPWDAFWGQRYAIVRDPDGNLVDLFAAQG